MTEFWQREGFDLGANPFEAVAQIKGEVFREVKGRTTLRFERDGKSFFLKLHKGLRLSEILKTALQFKRPTLGARGEWLAIRHLEAHNIPTMSLVAYGETGRLSSHCSFVITEDLNAHTDLETFCKDWQPSFGDKIRMIEAVADTASAMHHSGMNHRDFYLCHLYLPNGALEATGARPPLHIIDLHRAQIRSRVPQRWRLKDLSGLYYSCIEWNLPLTERDYLRFMRRYSGEPLRKMLKKPGFWFVARDRAKALREKVLARET